MQQLVVGNLGEYLYLLPGGALSRNLSPSLSSPLSLSLVQLRSARCGDARDRSCEVVVLMSFYTFPSIPHSLPRCCSSRRLPYPCPTPVRPFNRPAQDEREEGKTEPSQNRFSDRSAEQMKLSTNLDSEGRQRDTDTKRKTATATAIATATAVSASVATATGSVVGEEGAPAEGDRQSVRGK